jgi:hypothetical protein
MKEQEKHPIGYFVFLSALGGAAAAYTLAINFYQSSLKTTLDWITTLFLLTFGFGAAFLISLPPVWNQFRSSSTRVRSWFLILVLFSALCFTLNFTEYSFGTALIFQIFVCSILVSPGLLPFNRLLEKKHPIHFVVAWVLGSFFSFFGIGFLQNFYPASWLFLLLAIPLNILATLVWEVILEHLTASLREAWKEKVIPLAVLAIGFAFLVLTIRLLSAYENLFSVDYFLPDPNLVPLLLGLAILAQSWSALIIDKLDQLNWRSARLIHRIKSNLPGLLLASAIVIGTFALALPFTSSVTAKVDNYFDTDSVDWINRLSAEVEDLLNLRSVHPFAFLILRPPTWLLALLLNGDKFHAAILLNSIGGGLCVYLTWLFFQRRTGNTAYALSIAAILGLSASHLILSTFLETYIFSAAALIAFLLLLQSDQTSLKHFVPVGLLTFGITITNFVQTCIVYIMTPARRRSFFVYTVTVMSIAVLLAFVQDVLYPSSNPFFIPSNLLGERAYRFNILEAEPRLILSRINLLLRHITLFDVVAPRPLVLTEEVGCSFPCFQTYYKYRGIYVISSYVGFGSLLARSWFIALALAGGLYLWKLIKFPRETHLQSSLLLIVLFNFILHIFYGDDPMLYSPDWTYAVVFFFGISYEIFAGKKSFQVALLVFLVCLLVNNLDLFRKVLEAISPFV